MRRFTALLLALCLLLPLSACGKRKEQIFTAVLPGSVASLDPQTAAGAAAEEVISLLYEGLCRVGENGEALPGVAERWEHNQDYTEFTFHLRKARWSDGSAVTAEDFVFGISRALNPETGAVGLETLLLIKNAAAYHSGTAEADALGLSAPADNRLIVRLESGYPDFPLLTAGVRFMPCSQEFFEACEGHYGLSAEYVLGNGPYVFPHRYAWDVDYNERSFTLARAGEYRGGRKPRGDGLSLLVDYDGLIDEDPAAALIAGSADVLRVSGPQAEAAAAQGCEILTLNDGVTGLLLNPAGDNLGYVRTRQLFLMTLEREELLARAGDREEARGLMAGCVRWNGGDCYSPGDAFYTAQDDDTAALMIPSLLQLMNWERIPSITVLCPDDESSVEIANGFLVSWNAKLGNAFNIEPVPEAVLRRRIASGDYQAALYTLQAGGATPFDALLSLGKSAMPNFENTGSWNDLDFSYSALLGSLAVRPTREGFREAENELVYEALFYPICAGETLWAAAPGVEGVALLPDGRPDFTDARKK